jgi:predicted nucleic acid-binding protein
VAFVDTDVIVRLITRDDPAKHQAAQSLFTAVEEGKQSLACPVTVIADAVSILTSRRLYALDRALVAAALGFLVDLPHFRVAKRRTARRALDLFAATRLDFGDAMLVAATEDAGDSELFSYDRDFDHVHGIKRHTPHVSP